MATRVDPTLLKELKEYGAVGVEKCFNCGNCTAICPLTSDEYAFPRNMIRMVQVGQREKMTQSLDPWLCYYCGDCSVTCPKDANPGETMMAARRWLTAQYDVSGHGADLYKSNKAVWKAVIGYALIPLVLLIVFHLTATLGLHSYGGIVTDRVDINAFAPTLWVWVIVLIDFALLGVRLLRNVINMFQLTMGKKSGNEPIPRSVYISEFKTLLQNAFTQKRWKDCGENQEHWLKHIFLVSGYATMLVLIVGLLWWFQTDEIYPIYHPQRWLGYYAAIVLLYTSGASLLGRIHKEGQLYKFSHHTDWLFSAFLFVGTLTGILLHVFRYAGWAWPTYIMYTVHCMILIAMLDTEVGIGKWTHMLYRPLATYFQEVRAKAEEKTHELAGALAAAD